MWRQARSGVLPIHSAPFQSASVESPVENVETASGLSTPALSHHRTLHVYLHQIPCGHVRVSLAAKTTELCAENIDAHAVSAVSLTLSAMGTSCDKFETTLPESHTLATEPDPR
jgi:hypothetical protein